MFARLALTLAIFLHASPAWLCVVSCRLHAQLASVDCRISACIADPLVVADACSRGANACAGCCSAAPCEPEPVSHRDRPCESGGCPDCALCICVLAPPDSYLAFAAEIKAPAPDATPMLPWYGAALGPEAAPPAPVAQAPPRPPWTPQRSVLSVWTI